MGMTKAYKRPVQKLIMGAREAVVVLDMLRDHGLLSERTARRYVLEALYRGTEVREGTAVYDELMQPVYGEVFRSQGRIGGRGATAPQEEALRSETADYLRQVISAATGARAGVSGVNGPFDGFSREAYDEVSEMLGRHGRRYLGASGRFESLMPGRSRVSAMLQDEAEAELRELREQLEDKGPFEQQELWKPLEPMADPAPYPSGPMADWNDHWPGLDPMPGAFAIPDVTPGEPMQVPWGYGRRQFRA
jgi:hypothetical protein